MNMLTLSIIFLIIMILASIAAYIKTPAGAKMPMQWGLDGKVNWRASKVWAVSLFPAMAVLVLGLLLGIFAAVGTSEVPEFLTFGIVGFNCLLFLALHVGYLYFAVRDANSQS